MSNEITAYFKGRSGVAESVYQYDYGMVLVIDGIDFINNFDCYFSTMGEDEAIPAIGSDNRVAIPNDCLTRAGDVTLHIPTHTGENDREVEYVVTFRVIGRARPVDDGTEEEQSAVSQAIALLNHTNSSVIETIDAYLDENADSSIQEWLDEHPEATTTVQDNSLTTAKYKDASISGAKLQDQCLTTSKYQNGSISEEKLTDSLRNSINGTFSVETGSSDKDYYSVITIPKELYSMSLELTSGDPLVPTTLKEYAIEFQPDLCINISNTDRFIHGGTRYGEDYTLNNHGDVFALKTDSIDFDVFKAGTVFSNLIGLGYDAAVSGWNCLIEDGVRQEIDWDYATFANPNPRQTLAWDDDNWYVYTSYGRISHPTDEGLVSKPGLTMLEIRDFCEAKEWPNVAALDGGGSIFVASGNPFRQLSPCLNNGHFRDAYLCVAFFKRTIGGQV